MMVLIFVGSAMFVFSLVLFAYFFFVICLALLAVAVAFYADRQDPETRDRILSTAYRVAQSPDRAIVWLDEKFLPQAKQ